MAATDQSLLNLLNKLTTSLTSTASAAPDANLILPPKDGISLLDVKNELFLSYIQNLTFLILVKLRHGRDSRTGNGKPSPSTTKREQRKLEDEITRQLVSLRVYLDKGVRPIENRLKFQIDKVVRAAEDVARAQEGGIAVSKKTGTKSKSKAKIGDASGSEDEDEDNEDEDDDEDEDEEEKEMSYRPNAAAFTRQSNTQSNGRSDLKSRSDRDSKSSGDGIYRPPRIQATSLPTTDAKQPRQQKPQRSAVLENYISSEISGAPTTEISIGADIGSSGRHVKSARERKADAERQEYEETNFVRLPGLSKKDKAKEKAARGRDGGFMGEDLKGLGSGLDRIERLTRKRRGGDLGGGGKRRR